MTWKKTILTTVIAGSMGAGAYLALPAGAATRPSLSPAATAAPAAPTAPATAAPTATPTTPNACEGREEWPDVANGSPAGLDRHDQGGVYLWHGVDGWHLVVTHRGSDRMEFTGYITTNGTIAAQRVYDERDDHVRVGAQDHTAFFRFANFGGFDGMDFETHCADTLTVHLMIDGHEVTPEQVFIGHNKTNPTSVPLHDRARRRSLKPSGAPASVR
jgi:hypothetical protein